MDTFLETVVVLLALIGVWSLTPDVAAPDASDENAMNEIIAKYIEK